VRREKMMAWSRMTVAKGDSHPPQKRNLRSVRNPSIPGTDAANFAKSAGFNRLFAKLKMAPAPPGPVPEQPSAPWRAHRPLRDGVCPSSLRHGNEREQARSHHRISRPRLGQSPYVLAGARSTAGATGFGGASAISTMPMIRRAGTSPSRCPCSPTVSKASSPMMAP
jgi:hypothetical protein